MTRSFRAIAALVICAVTGYAPAQSSGGSYGITHSVIAPAQTSSGGGFGMTGTIGQASAATAGAGTFQLVGGFAAANTASDRIFSNGFETN